MRSAEKQLEATHENSSESLEDIFAPHIVVRWILSVFLLPQTLGKRAFVPKLLVFFLQAFMYYKVITLIKENLNSKY